MSWLQDTLALYGRVFARAAVLLPRSWILVPAFTLYTVLLALATAAAMSLGALGPVGILGGLVVTVVGAACASSWLALVEEAVTRGGANPADLPRSFAAYLGDLLTLGFILWGLDLVARLALAPFPYLQIVFVLALLVFGNAVPELVYLGRLAPAELLVASYRFIGERWIEWFPPNVLLAVAGAAILVEVPSGPYGVVRAIVMGLVMAYGSLVRGLLFIELTTTNRRAREFQRRAAGG